MTAFSIYIQPFVEELVRRDGRSEDDVVAELRAAAMRAAVRRFGDATPIEVEFDEIGAARFWQRLEVVETVTDPRRQVSRAAYRAFEREPGPVLRARIEYTNAASTPPAFASLLPLPVHDPELWDLVTDELNAVIQRHFPVPPLAPGTIGDVIAHGRWAIGLAATAGDVTVTIASSFFDVLSLRPTGGWIDYGFVLQIDRGAAREELLVDSGENDANVRAWTELPSDESARPRVIELLATIAGELAQGASPNPYRWLAQLVEAALRPARPDSLIAALPAILAPLERFSTRVVTDDGEVTFRTLGVYAPTIGTSPEAAKCAMRILAQVPDLEPASRGAESAKSTPTVAVFIDGEMIEPDGQYRGDVISLGYVSRGAGDRRGPTTPEETADVARLVEVCHGWLAASLEAHARAGSLDRYATMDYFYAFPGYFPLVQLIEARLELGPPGPPPVPAFDDAALDRAAAQLEPVRGKARKALLEPPPPPKSSQPETAMRRALEAAGWGVGGKHVQEKPSTTVAVYRVAGWTIRLDDDLSERPFRNPSIQLVPPEGGDPISILMVDVWNPQTAMCLDGDAFAFRRFVTWLREAILRGGHDETVTWQNTSEDDDYEDEDAEDADEPVERDRTITMAVSEWLRFGIPYFGDRFLVDWRVQWDIVLGGEGIASMAGIYSFSAAYRDELGGRSVREWRRFLCAVIDPRFATYR